MTNGRNRAKRALGRAYHFFSSGVPRRVILLYHAIDHSSWGVSPDAFQSQLDWLQQNAKVVSLENLLVNQDAAPLTVSITFDDGYESVFSEALPRMRAAGMAGTVYINPNCMGEWERRASDAAIGHYENQRFLLWDEVAGLHQAGWSIGSHGLDHLDLTRLTPVEAERQVRESREVIGKRLAAPCLHFAYAWGRHNATVRTLIQAAGYQTGVAGIHGAVSLRSDPMQLPRIDIRRGFTAADFAAVLRGDWDYLGWLQSLRARLH
jgi:peptidoglycan/xylan/chitin deacetylase (PgdA/CDA1 family)